MEDAYKTMNLIHPGNTKMYKNLEPYYQWPKMKLDIAKCVGECVTYARVKVRLQNHMGVWNFSRYPWVNGKTSPRIL